MEEAPGHRIGGRGLGVWTPGGLVPESVVARAVSPVSPKIRRCQPGRRPNWKHRLCPNLRYPVPATLAPHLAVEGQCSGSLRLTGMDSPERPRRPTRFVDKRELQIYDALLFLGPGPAVYFRDACSVMAEEPPYPTTSHIVGHLVREVESAIREVLVAAAKSRGSPAEPVDEKNSHRGEIHLIARFRNLPDDTPPIATWLARTGRQNPGGFHRKAHRDALSLPRPLDADFRAWWSETLDWLLAVTRHLQPVYLDFVGILDRLLERPVPLPGDLTTLEQRVPQTPVLLEYFFGHLEHQGWLGPLREAKFFRSPPPPHEDSESGGSILPRWPQTFYLRKMAGKLGVQTVVRDIVAEIPDVGNPQVDEALIEVLLALPPDLVRDELISRAEAWLTTPVGVLFPERFVKLAVQVAPTAGSKPLMSLVGALVRLELPDGSDRTSDLRPVWARRHHSLSSWYYERILSELREPITQRFKLEYLQLLVDAVAEVGRAVELRDGTGPSDLVHVFWRPAIEDHGQNIGLRSGAMLIGAVRDVAERIVELEPGLVTQVVANLEAPGISTLERVVLYLLGKFPTSDVRLAEDRLTREKLFLSSQHYHEYYHLLKAAFPMLQPTGQKTILDWIEAGPESQGEDSDIADTERYRRSWQRRWLSAIEGSLPANWVDRFRALCTEVGAPEHPDFLMYVGVWSGETSPMTTQELGDLSIDQLVTYLQEWRPQTQNPLAPSREALGRELTALVEREGARLAEHAQRFVGLDPTYARSFVDGIAASVRQGKAKIPADSWTCVLHLCKWICSQPEVEGIGRRSIEEGDPDWLWSRRSASALLLDILERRLPPPSTRRLIWEVLLPLTDDPDPAPGMERGSAMDAPTLAINSVRGRAVQAVVQYGLWLRAQVVSPGGVQEPGSSGFESMPEVSAVLDRHLDESVEMSAAVRSCYGQFFPWLVLLDKGWASRNVVKVFWTEATSPQLAAAAWESYLAFCAPYDEVFALLKDRYAAAIESLQRSDSQVTRLDDVRYRLVEHLVLLYRRGVLCLDEPGGLLSRLEQAVAPLLHAHCITFIGHVLSHPQASPNKEEVARLASFLARRLAVVDAAVSPVEAAKQLEGFGWWFASGTLDTEWSLDQLHEVLRRSAKVEPDHQVVERLADLAEAYPQRVLQVFSLMVKGIREPWVLRSWRDGAMRLLRALLLAPEVPVRSGAEDLVNVIVAQGHIEFRDILKQGMTTLC